MHAILHMLPKPEGGTRPIGLLASYVRAWGATRRAKMSEWHAAYLKERPFLFAGPGRDALDPVWEALTRAQVAQHLDPDVTAASTLLDMTKCFDMVKHICIISR